MNYNNTQRLFGIALAACLTLSACKKDATIKLPEVPSKLVIISYISPQDSLIRVDVNLSQPLFNQAYNGQFQPLTQAIVQISSSLGSYTLPYNTALECYALDSNAVKIRAGLSYTLSVQSADGKAIRAITEIPEQNRSLMCETSINSQNTSTSDLRTSWYDTPGQEDYYRILREVKSFDYVFDGSGQNITDTIYRSYLSGELVTDSENPGGQLKRNFSIDNGLPGDSLNVYLLHLTKDYYNYVVKIPLATETNPFSEPVQMYSNVVGGYGIFAGYNSYRVRIKG